MLANTYEKRTGRICEDKLAESFGLVQDGMPTNAGLLFVDNWVQRIFLVVLFSLPIGISLVRLCRSGGIPAAV